MKLDYEKLFKMNYGGYIFSSHKEGYNEEFLKSKAGKKMIKKSKKRQKKHLEFMREHGFDPSEVWNLDNTIAKFVYPRIKYFRTILHGYPNDLTEKKWDKILSKMEYSFGTILKEDDDWQFNKDELKKVRKGFELFGKFFMNLWD